MFAAFQGTVLAPKCKAVFGLPVDEKDSCLWTAAGAIFGGRFWRPICFIFSNSPEELALGSVNATVSRGLVNCPRSHFSLPYGLLSPRCGCHGVLTTSRHAWRLLQLPVMHDSVARHRWAAHTFSPLLGEVSACIASGDWLSYVSLPIPAVCCIATCLAGLLPRTLAWWARAHALHLGATVWPPGSTVRRPLPVVGKSEHAVSRP